MKTWFNRLKVSQKLMLISIFFVMPDSLMLYLFITGINETIHFAQLEKKGNDYQRPLEELLELLPQHGLLAQGGLDGQAQVGEELSLKQAQIETAFDALEAVDARIGIDLQFTQEGLAKRKREHYHVRIVRKEWRDLKAGLSQLTAEALAAQHMHLRTDVRTMITHAGDLSNLILDPDLDSYYVMDATLLALPATQDRLATVLSEGEAIIRRQTISNPERQQLAIHATLLKEADLDRINGSLQTALNEDANFYGSSATLQARVPPALNEYTASVETFINLTKRLVSSEKLDVTDVEFLAAGSKAREASFKLWKIADQELDILLQKRIEAYANRRTRSLMVTALALLAAISFVTFITRSISGPLRQQAADLQTANRTLEAEIVERNRAEAELRNSEAQLAAAQKIARIGSWEWDIPRNKVSWSDENYRIHGFECREFEASHEVALSFVHPEDRSFSDAVFQKALQDGRPFSFEQRIIRQDGTERIVHQRGDVVLAGGGRAVKIFGTAQDVTEISRARQHQEEVATNVLHNVGNVLNSVNISTSLLTSAAKKSKVSSLDKILRKCPA
ncbi:MAG: PAS domain-containing protein [Verrucomicrobiota bacterium]